MNAVADTGRVACGMALVTQHGTVLHHSAEGVAMSAMPSPAQSEVSEGALTAKPSGDVPVVPPDLRNYRFPERRSFAERTRRALARSLIIFGIGVGATLAWQSYGGTAREMIANASPRLAWLAPPAAPVAQDPAETIAPAARADAPAPPSPDQRQVGAASLDLDAIRQSVDRIAASQDQMTRAIGELAASQEQMTQEIAKLQSIEQSLLNKHPEPPPPPPRPARPAARPAQPPAAQPPAAH